MEIKNSGENMKKVITTEKHPIKLWTDEIEDGALEQAKHLANLPFLFKHVAIMPDVHQGYGMPIGGVIATKDVIIPNAVGVDIGCGMIAAKTSLYDDEILRMMLPDIVDGIYETIPLGFNHHKEKQKPWPYLQILEEDGVDLQKDFVFDYSASLYQKGTLGGGNHFIEVQKDNDNNVWIMIHSGSRNVGYKVAEHYNQMAKDLNKKWFSGVPLEWDLSFLPLNSKEGENYIKEMNVAVTFARVNRYAILEQVINVIRRFIPTLNIEKIIDVPHNYVSLENHYKHNVWVHRKGAVRARKGDIVIISGSQGTHSYIAEGLGNPDSFMSCSHGAGRVMGRKEAKRRLNLEEQKKKLGNQGIIHRLNNIDALDEAPDAYKDINVVLGNESDLVKPVIELQPLAVIKGD